MGFSVSVPPLPSLPSLPSLRTLLDTEPQVLYPVSATNTHPSSPVRTGGGGKNLPPVPDDWGRERGRSRRSSVTSTCTTTSGLGLSGLTLTPAGSRPGHRRSHSAVPAVTSSPLGRLTDSHSHAHAHVRNPLAMASTSVLSLPTLAEDRPSFTSSHGEKAPPTPSRARRGSRASIISITTTASVPSSPRRTVPNSLPLIVPPPPRERRPKPPRSRTSLDVRPSSPATESTPVVEQAQTQTQTRPQPQLNLKSGLTRHASYTRGSGPARGAHKSRGSVGDISDVTVLATWSVPPSPQSRNGVGGEEEGNCISPATESLASFVDNLPLPLAVPVPAGRTGPRPTHRATHSSPNVLALSARPVVGRIRTQAQTVLGSSPGSLLSCSDASSPTSSLISIPPHSQVHQGEQASVSSGGGWKMPWGSRRGSVASIFSSALTSVSGSGADEGKAAAAPAFVEGNADDESPEGEEGEEEEEDSGEEYIDYDDIPVF